MRIAVADLGSNSTRLLVAEVSADERIEQLERRTEVTRLGAGLEASGRLSDEAIERVCAALEGFREVADAHGAERRIAVATSAAREAANGSELTDRVRDRIGFDVRTIDGDEEARLSFRGATARRVAAAPRPKPALVIDVGGGSTELVIGLPGRTPEFHVSTRLGSVRQTERHLDRDPPEHDELEQLAREANWTIADAVPAAIREQVTDAIAVAGTPTSLAAIEQELEPYDPERVDGFVLGLAAAERVLAELALLPVEERREVTGLHPERAPTIVAGAAILIEALRLFGLDRVEVSEADVLDGAALDAVLGPTADVR